MTRLMLTLWLYSLEFVDDKVDVDLWLYSLEFVDNQVDVDPVVVLT